MIYIGIPTYDGKLHWTTVAGLVNTARWCGELKIGYALDVIPGDAFISKARNVIVQRFLASPATELLFVDADVGFDWEGVKAVCQAEPPIVMGLYKMKMPPPSRYPALLHNPITRHPSDPNLIKLQYGPAGFMRIRREVFEKMIEKWPDEYYHNIGENKVYDFFPSGRFNQHFIGEDLTFCNRAHECGFELWAYQNVALKHSGENCWESKWAIDVLQIEEPEAVKAVEKTAEEKMEYECRAMFDELRANGNIEGTYEEWLESAKSGQKLTEEIDH